MGAGSRTLFSLAFLVVAATSSLLLTWSIWWLATVGTSVPARRPFFLPGETPPSLIAQAASAATAAAPPAPVFQYSLAGGWPAAASALRLAASGVGVSGALTYALVGTYGRAGLARAVIGGGMAGVAGLATAAAVTDGVAIGRARSECAARRRRRACPAIRGVEATSVTPHPAAGPLHTVPRPAVCLPTDPVPPSSPP